MKIRENIRQLGASDLYMYYMNVGKYTLDSRISITMSDDVDEGLLKAACKRAMDVFPEFSFQPVIIQNKLYARQCENEVVILRADDGADKVSVHFGTEQTNGLVFLFILDARDQRKLTLSYFHGMSDFAGVISFFKTILYWYGIEKGMELKVAPEALLSERIRTERPSDWNRMERLDPYRYFQMEEKTSNGQPKPQMQTPFIPSPMLLSAEDPSSRVIRIKTSVRAFKEKTKEYHSGFASLLFSVLARAVSDGFQAPDAAISAFLPVDYRRVYASDSVVNFSDSVVLHSDRGLRQSDRSGECEEIKKMLEAGRTKEYVNGVLCSKTLQVEQLLGDERGYTKVVEGIVNPPADTPLPPPPVSFLITYPGSVSLPDFLKGMVRQIHLEMVNPNLMFYFIAYSYEEEFWIDIVQHFEEETLARAILKQFEELSMQAELVYSEKHICNMFEPSLLEVVDLEV